MGRAPGGVSGVAVLSYTVAAYTVAAFAAVCPPPPARAAAALSPDGDAHVLTFGVSTACWWAVDEDGEAEVVRHFDLATSRPERIRWDDGSQAICIDLVDPDGTRRTRTFPAPVTSDTARWGDAPQAR